MSVAIEDKTTAIDLLGQAYQKSLEPIDRMVYLYDHYNQAELVIVYDEDKKILMEIDVTWSSICSMLEIVTKAVYKDIVLGGEKK